MLAQAPRRPAPDPAKETVILRRARSGNKAASQAIVTQYLRYVVKHVMPWAGDTVELADLVQEGVLGLYHAMSKYDAERGPFRPYAARWIRAYARAYAQKAGRHDGGEPDENLPIDGPDPEAQCLGGEARDVARRVIPKRLSLFERHTLEENILHRKSLARAAETYGYTREAARQARTRGVKYLRDAVLRDRAAREIFRQG